MGTSEMRGSGQSLLPGAKACHCFSARTNRTTHEWGTEVGGRPVLGCCRGLEAARTRLGRPNFAPRRHVGLRAQRRLLWQLPRPSAVWTFVATLGDERHLMRPSDLGSLRSADPTVKMIHARENKPLQARSFLRVHPDVPLADHGPVAQIQREAQPAEKAWVMLGPMIAAKETQSSARMMQNTSAVGLMADTDTTETVRAANRAGPTNTRIIAGTRCRIRCGSPKRKSPPRGCAHVRVSGEKGARKVQDSAKEFHALLFAPRVTAAVNVEVG
eukprot:CAMPEP_0172599544 /NCGR_PEP_ID=MMETSP1068-20121228/19634_1 /TAXON_ID=35684 /ORGANISM="Pseudopedinella elastica, Strain CCMP716" /LENGTH=271 /DNA_ID=CAMNT_0013399821 /DNA_START=141 /DNA_END=956 /DNA_ORIENTATION=+